VAVFLSHYFQHSSLEQTTHATITARPTGSVPPRSLVAFQRRDVLIVASDGPRSAPSG
jgi:hypothetical protein